MSKTQQYLDECKAALGIESDYALAKLLETSSATLSQYRSEKNQMNNYIAAKVAVLMGRDPMELIAAIELEREKDEKKR